jgi:hypothetical protein
MIPNNAVDEASLSRNTSTVLCLYRRWADHEQLADIDTEIFCHRAWERAIRPVTFRERRWRLA